MKKGGIWITLSGIAFIVFQSFSIMSLQEQQIPDDVNEVLQTSCFGCHNNEAGSKDAREAFNLETWNEYRLTKKIGLLGEISEVVQEGKMPPARFLESNPDRKLTEAQKKLIIEWAEKESRNLMEGSSQ